MVESGLLCVLWGFLSGGFPWQHLGCFVCCINGHSAFSVSAALCESRTLIQHSAAQNVGFGTKCAFLCSVLVAKLIEQMTVTRSWPWHHNVSHIRGVCY